MKRQLHIVAYDIAGPRRLARALHAVRSHATGGQKSVHECWLGPAELAQLRGELERIVQPRTDRVLFLRLEAQRKTRTLGIGRLPADPPFFWIG